MTAEKQLEGKVALITGSVRRIGRATALALAKEGADIVVHARSSGDEARAVAEEIEALGSRALVQLADVTDEAAVQQMVATVIETFGRLDILVNNAAIRKQVPFLEMSLEEWHEVIDTILDGAFVCSQACIPHMIRQGGGTIVNLGGLAAHLGAYYRAHVVAGKAGIAGFTKALAIEFGEQGITANCVAPGKIGGPRSAAGGEPPPFPGGGEPLVGRMGEAEEVAAMIRTLCLPTGRFITGQTIHVNGGLYLP